MAAETETPSPVESLSPRNGTPETNSRTTRPRKQVTAKAKDTTKASQVKSLVHEQRAKDILAQWWGLRQANPLITVADAAKKLGVGETSLWRYMKLGRAQGWFTWDSHFDQIENEIIPQALNVISEHLAEGDKTVAMHTAQHTVYKTYVDSKGVGDEHKMTLSIKFESPVTPTQPIIEGQIVGKPKALPSHES